MAGHRRNQLMVDLQLLFALAFISPCTRATCRQARPHDSHGTADAVRRITRAGIPIQRITT